MNKSIVLFLLAIFFFLPVRSQSVSEYDVSVIFPKARVQGALPTIITRYALKKYGIPISADDALDLVNEITKDVYGGIPVSGTLYIDDHFVTYKPGWGSSLLGVGFAEFKIPLSEITDASSQDYMVVGKQVTISTISGNIRFVLNKATHWYNPLVFDDKEICNKINSTCSFKAIFKN